MSGVVPVVEHVESLSMETDIATCQPAAAFVAAVPVRMMPGIASGLGQVLSSCCW